METLIETITSSLQIFGMNLPVAIVAIVLAGVATIGHIVNGGSLKIPMFVAFLMAAFFWSGLSGCKHEPRIGDVTYKICTTESQVNDSLRIYYRDETRTFAFKQSKAEPKDGELRWCVKLWNHKFEFGTLQFQLALDDELKGTVVIRRSEVLENFKKKISEVPINLPDRITVITILDTTGPVVKF